APLRLAPEIAEAAALAVGLDARRIRKAVLSALAHNKQIASNPGSLTPEAGLAAVQHAQAEIASMGKDRSAPSLPGASPLRQPAPQPKPGRRSSSWSRPIPTAQLARNLLLPAASCVPRFLPRRSGILPSSSGAAACAYASTAYSTKTR